MTIKETTPPKEMPTWAVGTNGKKSFYRGNTDDIIQCFQDSMQQSGIVLDGEITADGLLHRAHILGQKPGSLNGAYVLHLDGKPAGYWQDMSNPDSKCTWKYQGEFTNQVKIKPAALRAARQKKEADLARRQEEAALTAQRIWQSAKSAPANNPYLVKKDICAHSVRVLNGDLVVPLLNADDQIVSLQFIKPDGSKRFLAGGIKKGCYFSIGDKGYDVMICEGYATAVSIWERIGWQVVVAFDAGNLGRVARLMRDRYPNSRIVIAGDNDLSGVGQSAAKAAAEAVGAQVMIPRLTGDWNDWRASIRGAL